MFNSAGMITQDDDPRRLITICLISLNDQRDETFVVPRMVNKGDDESIGHVAIFIFPSFGSRD